MMSVQRLNRGIGIRQIIALLLMPLLLLAGFSLPGFAFAEISSYAQAVNKAGAQRMLTQRISKAYNLKRLAEIGLVAAPNNFDRELKEAIALFETQLLELKKFNKQPQVAELIQRVDADWSEFRDLALSSFSVENAEKLWRSDEKLLLHCEAVMQQMLDDSGTIIDRYVNISGRQRMLSQRISKYYMLNAVGIERASMREFSEQARNEFSGALSRLQQAEENSSVITARLEEVSLQWRWLVGALDLSDQPQFPIIVNDASDKTLRLMHQITGFYELLANQ